MIYLKLQMWVVSLHFRQTHIPEQLIQVCWFPIVYYIYPHIISYPIGQLLGVPTLRSSIPVDPSLVRHPASLLSVPVVVVSGVTLLALLGL